MTAAAAQDHSLDWHCKIDAYAGGNVWDMFDCNWVGNHVRPGSYKPRGAQMKLSELARHRHRSSSSSCKAHPAAQLLGLWPDAAAFTTDHLKLSHSRESMQLPSCLLTRQAAEQLGWPPGV